MKGGVMKSYQICPSCYKKFLQYRHLLQKHKKGLISKKPKMKYCKICSAYIDMEKHLAWHRYPMPDSLDTDPYNNCIVGCGYGMFAPRFYKENVIDVRRGIT